MKKLTSIAAGLVALTLVAAACGGDDSSSDTTAAAADTTVAATDTTAASTDTTAASAETTAGGTGEAVDLDTNGDGKLQIGIATPGPRNDGAYYQALVDGLSTWSSENGFEEPIVVDNIKPEEAQTTLDSLARQDVDIVAVGAGEIADSLPELTEKYGDVIWYCNCGGGFQELPNLIQQGDDGSEISYSAGVATGLLLQAAGKDSSAMIGNNSFNFEKESFGGFKLGLTSVDPAFADKWTYVATGSFNDVAAATEAFNNLKDQGVGAIYPYLGGSHEAVVKLSNENDIITMSAGAANACERTDLHYDIAVKFDSGLYAISIFDKIKSGEITRGQTYTFHVGVDPEVGAVICDPTPEQTTAMDAAYERIASGELQADFDANKAEAYAS
jgi:basic membrane protein A